MVELSAVEAVVGGDNEHFLLVEDKQEVAMVASSCCGVKVACKGCKLLDKFVGGW